MAALLVAAMSFSFVACSSDDDEITEGGPSLLDGAWRLTRYQSEWHWTDGDGEGSKDEERNNEVIIFKTSTQKVITAGYDPDKSDKSWNIHNPITYTYDSTTNTINFSNGRSYVILSVSQNKLVLRKEDVESEKDYRYDTYTYKKVTDPETLLGAKIDFGDKENDPEEMKVVQRNIKENRMLLAYWNNSIDKCPHFYLYSDGTCSYNGNSGNWNYDKESKLLSFSTGATMHIISLSQGQLIAEVLSDTNKPTYTWNANPLDNRDIELLQGSWKRSDGSTLTFSSSNTFDNSTYSSTPFKFNSTYSSSFEGELDSYYGFIYDSSVRYYQDYNWCGYILVIGKEWDGHGYDSEGLLTGTYYFEE